MRARAIVGCAVVVAVAVLGLAQPAGANIPGAIFTTDSGCTGVNVNVFSTKADVHLDGGPKGASGSTIPDSAYHVKVTAPDGTLLGQSAGADVHVSGGEFEQCYSLFSLTSFADTPNPGGEYKVWISPLPTFPHALSKTDNFKVVAEPERAIPTVTTAVSDDRTGADITDAVVSVVEGETFTVHDLANVTGSEPTPTGSVTFNLYANGVCDPTDGSLSSETVELASGTASSSQSVALPLGDPVALEYSYQASYEGDDVYEPTLAECEPFFVAIVAGEAAPPTESPDPVGGVAVAPELAFTGSSDPWLTAAGVALLLTGTALVTLTRRRTRVMRI